VDRDPERRLRVGYLSADLREHAVAYFLEAILEGHDRRAVEVVVFHIGAGDEATKRMRGKADTWLPLFPCPDEQLLGAMRAEGVDILVELAGHTASNRLPVVARRAAPVQVTYIGYPNTTGVPGIDYRIIDAATDPPGGERWATERLVRLDPCFLCYRAAESAPPVAPRPSSGPVMFGSFNNLAKLSPQTADLWSRVVRAVPGSKLVLKGKALADESIAARFHERFASRGIGPERLEFLQHTPATGEHLGAYAKVDIALDPFPYSGTTTTCEAMWMGVPVVTMEGSRHSSRVGVSLLRTVGLPELIAKTPDEYVADRDGAGGDRDRSTQLRASLRDRVRASPLCDEPRSCPSSRRAYRRCGGPGAPPRRAR
jgi:predicted O-linked N-acetylglucosamine transferase (SPINDLY family)